MFMLRVFLISTTFFKLSPCSSGWIIKASGIIFSAVGIRLVRFWKECERSLVARVIRECFI